MLRWIWLVVGFCFADLEDLEPLEALGADGECEALAEPAEPAELGPGGAHKVPPLYNIAILFPWQRDPLFAQSVPTKEISTEHSGEPLSP